MFPESSASVNRSFMPLSGPGETKTGGPEREPPVGVIFEIRYLICSGLRLLILKRPMQQATKNSSCDRGDPEEPELAQSPATYKNSHADTAGRID